MKKIVNIGYDMVQPFHRTIEDICMDGESNKNYAVIHYNPEFDDYGVVFEGTEEECNEYRNRYDTMLRYDFEVIRIK